MKSKSIILLTMLIAISSCKITEHTTRSVDIDKTDIIMSPMIVDIHPDFSKKVCVRSNYCRTKEEAVQEARYRAIMEDSIDIVVDPIVQIEDRAITYKRYRATITGFAGYYENARTIYEDIEQNKNLSREEIEKYLILHKPEVLRYMNDHGKIINIHHNDYSKEYEENSLGNDSIQHK